MRLLVLASGVFVLPLLRTSLEKPSARVKAVAAIALACIAGLAALVPDSRRLWATMHGTFAEVVTVAEDGSGVSLLRSNRDGSVTVYSNGLGQSEIPFTRWHLSLGILPTMLHPRPESIAIIGLGSGATLFGAGGRGETRSITLIEIVAPQAITLRELERSRSFGGLNALLTDPRISFHFTDARSFIMLGDAKYDIIEADALRPESAYAGNLYSEEYFELLKAHLEPGGYAVTWAPTNRVINTFVKVFPHALLYRDAWISMLIGSNSPLEWSSEKVVQRMSAEPVRSWFARAGVSLDDFALAAGAASIVLFPPECDRSRISDTNTDLFPRDEFLATAARPASGVRSLCSAAR